MRRHHKARQHEIGARYAFQRAEIGAVLRRRLLETTQGVVVAHPVVLIPEMPAAPDEDFRFRNLQAVSELGLATDPGVILAQDAV